MSAAGSRRMLLLYPVVAAAALWPLLSQPSTHVAVGDGSGDSFQFLWNLWWVKVALVERVTTPFVTELLYWPESTSLPLHTLSSGNGALSIPLQLLWPGTAGLVFALNALTFLTFVLTGIAAHRLAESHGARPIGAMLAGLLAMVLPYRIWHVNHLNLVTMQWGLFCLLWLDRSMAPRAWRARAAFAIFAALTTYSDYEIAVYTVMAGSCLIAWRLISADREQRSILVRGTATAIGMAAVLHIPLFIAVARVWHDVRTPLAGDLYSANLGAFFLRPGNEAFLGPIFLLVMAVLIVRSRHTGFRFWATLGSIFLILSLGPTLRVGSTHLLHGLMPYAWLERALPFMDMGRGPVRMAGMGGVFLAVAAGVAFQPRALARSEWKAIALLLLLLAERWPRTRIATIEAAVPALYQQIANEEPGFAIRPLPEGYYHRQVYMFWQTVHRHPMTSGFVARPTNAVRRSITDWQTASPEELPARLAAAGVKYVIVHPEDKAALLRESPQVLRSGPAAVANRK